MGQLRPLPLPHRAALVHLRLQSILLRRRVDLRTGTSGRGSMSGLQTGSAGRVGGVERWVRQSVGDASESVASHKSNGKPIFCELLLSSIGFFWDEKSSQPKLLSVRSHPNCLQLYGA